MDVYISCGVMSCDLFLYFFVFFLVTLLFMQLFLVDALYMDNDTHDVHHINHDHS